MSVGLRLGFRVRVLGVGLGLANQVEVRRAEHFAAGTRAGAVVLIGALGRVEAHGLVRMRVRVRVRDRVRVRVRVSQGLGSGLEG